MKVLLALIFIFSIICNIQLYRGYNKLENKLSNSIQFEWEGLKKDIPERNSYIQITCNDNNTIYLNNINE